METCTNQVTALQGHYTRTEVIKKKSGAFKTKVDNLYKAPIEDPIPPEAIPKGEDVCTNVVPVIVKNCLKEDVINDEVIDVCNAMFEFFTNGLLPQTSTTK